MSDTLHDAFGQTQILQAEGHPEKGVGHLQRCVPFEASTYTCTQAVLAPNICIPKSTGAFVHVHVHVHVTG